MTRERPTSLTVLAIFHFIFGGLGLLCGVVGIATQASGLNRMGGGGGQGNEQKQMEDLTKRVEAGIEQASPWYKERQIVTTGLSLFLSALLLAGGFALWRLDSWAHPVNFAYVVLSVLDTGVSVFFLVVYDWPAAMKVLQNEAATDQATQTFKSFFEFGMYAATGFALVGLIYPLITLLVMLLPSTGRALSGMPAGHDAFGDDATGREPVGFDDPWPKRADDGGEGFTPRRPQDR